MKLMSGGILSLRIKDMRKWYHLKMKITLSGSIYIDEVAPLMNLVGE